MANLTVFSVEKLKSADYGIFAGLYSDFKSKAVSDYKFELEPLDYENFKNAVSKGLLECLILKENSIPTGFLVYTTLISFSVELNMIYLNSQEGFETKVRYLIKEFLQTEKDIVSKKVVTYPLLGEQEMYKDVLNEFDFHCVSQSVLKFDFETPLCLIRINRTKRQEIPEGYEIINWENKYFEDAIKIIYNNFKNANDALFDPRFKTKDGVKDVVSKITTSFYGEFLPQYTKILLKDKHPVGVCFVNVTGDSIVNIPLVAVEKQHREKKLGDKITSQAVREIVEDKLNDKIIFKEINVTTDTYNEPAVKMYEYCGFLEQYQYSQSYREP